jgi:TolB-like protein
VWVEKPFSAYRGDDPYVFVCYAHEDSDAIYREIAWLNDYGVNVWYDEGISPGQEWTEELASAIQNCTKVLYFVTPSSVVSEHCRRELNFAQEEGREVVAIHLEPTEVPAGLRLSLNNRQAIMKHELVDEEYRKRLMRVTNMSAGSVSAPAASPDSRPARKGLVLSFSIIALTIVAAAVWWSSARQEPSADDEARISPVAESARPPEVLPNSIAVLPFTNLSPDPDNAYFAAGIHEEVLNQLSKIEDLSVIARGTMVRYMNSDKSIPEIGKELKVVTVMAGSVRYAGDRVRITAQLIDAQSGAQLWSEAYEDNLEDIFRIQLSIASQIATTLEAKFSPQEQQRIGRRPTNNPKAYGHYLRALSGFGNFAATGPTHEALDAAISLDPNFAEALAFKAWIHGVESQFGPVFFGEDFRIGDQTRLINLAEQLAVRALQLDDQQALAHSALGYVHAYYREWENAREVNERAYNLAPQNYITASLGFLLALEDGDKDKAVRLADHSVSLNPADAANVWFISDLFYRNRMWDDAIQKADLVVTLKPEVARGYAQLARIYGKLGNKQEMHRNAALAEARSPGLPELIGIALAYGHIGALDDAKRIFDLAKSSGSVSGLNNEEQLWLNTAIGDYDAAMYYLEQGVQSNFPYGMVLFLYFYPNQPDYDPIRSRPEFDKLRQQILKPLR